MSEQWQRWVVEYRPCRHRAPWGHEEPNGPSSMWWAKGTVPACPQCEAAVRGVVVVHEREADQ